MSAKLLAWDSKERIAQLELESGEKVLIGGSYIQNSLFTCYATVKNMFGLPIKRIWKFAFITRAQNEKNLVHLDFGDYPPFYALVGYAMQFPSIDDMRWAQGKHASIFDREKAFDTLIAIGAIQLKP